MRHNCVHRENNLDWFPSHVHFFVKANSNRMSRLRLSTEKHTAPRILLQDDLLGRSTGSSGGTKGQLQPWP